jgi:hypothetical protein
MSHPIVPLSHHILNHLATRESRLLSLVVAVRNALGPDERIKGNLADAVKLSLQKLVASATVAEVDGMFSLRPAKTAAGFRGPASSLPRSKPAAGEEW